MADDRDTEPEGWRVPQRPALIAAAAVPLALLILVIVAGSVYNAKLRPKASEPVHAFPAPGIERYIHPGGDERVATPPASRPDPRLAAAKREVVRDGIPGWSTPQ